MKLRTRKALTGLALVTPMVAGCLVFYAAAMLLVGSDAVAWGVGQTHAWVGLENFRELLHNDLFLLACRNTVRFMLIGLPALLAVAYAAALMLKGFANQFRMVKSVLMLPYVMPVVGTVSLVEAIFAENGGLNWLASALKLPVQDWLNSPAAFWAAIALFLWKNTGYGIILLLSGLIAIEEDQYEAARLDGAAEWQQFRYITVPQMWYSVFFCTVFSMINAFKCFREILLLGGDHPDDSIYMLQHFINNTFENMNYPKLAAVLLLLTLPLWAWIFLLLGKPRLEWQLLLAVGLIVALTLGAVFTLGQFDLPSSLMPTDNIFDFAYYRQEFETVFRELQELDSNQESGIYTAAAYAKRQCTACAIGGGLGFLLLVLLPAVTNRFAKKPQEWEE